MSSTNVTEFYGLTQYVGTDKPSFTDNNEAFRAVDAALHGAVSDVADASDAVTALTGRVGDVEEAVTGLSGTVGTQGDAITVLQNKEISQDGDIAEVKAAALDMVCAFNEEAAQSVHAYAIGDFFRYNDVLYKASAVINIGDTIIPNTNCVATNVTEQLLNDVDKVGDLSSLTTTDKTSAVAAINEVNSDLNWNSKTVTVSGSGTSFSISEDFTKYGFVSIAIYHSSYGVNRFTLPCIASARITGLISISGNLTALFAFNADLTQLTITLSDSSLSVYTSMYYHG